MRIIELQVVIDLDIPTEVSDEQALKAIGLPKKKWEKVTLKNIKRIYECNEERGIVYDDTCGRVEIPFIKSMEIPHIPQRFILLTSIDNDKRTN